MKLFQNMTSGSRRVFNEIEFSEQFLEDLPRNIAAKIGPNWPSVLGGECV